MKRAIAGEDGGNSAFYAHAHRVGLGQPVVAEFGEEFMTKNARFAKDYFDKVRGDSESLGGLIIELFTRLPHAGEEIEHEKFKFRISSVDTRRIKKVKVTPIIEIDDVSRELS